MLNIFEDLNELLGLSDLVDINSNEVIKVDIKENEEGYEVLADLPGLLKEEVLVECDNNTLKIGVNKNKRSKDGKYLLREREVTLESREIEFPDIESTSVKAKLTDGVLSVFLKKIIKENKYICIE